MRDLAFDNRTLFGTTHFDINTPVLNSHWK